MSRPSSRLARGLQPSRATIATRMQEEQIDAAPGRAGPVIPAVLDRNRLRGRTHRLPSRKRGSPRTPIRGPSLNVEARTAGRYRMDALGSASFAPLRQVERARDGPRIGVRGDDMKTQSPHESEVEPAGINRLAPAMRAAGRVCALAQPHCRAASMQAQPAPCILSPGRNFRLPGSRSGNGASHRTKR